MPFEKPPKPPENEELSPRAIIIALLGFLALARNRGSQHDVFLRAPVKLPSGKNELSMKKLTPSETKETYDFVASFLDTDLESVSSIHFWSQQIAREFRKHPHGIELIAILLYYIEQVTNEQVLPVDVFQLIRSEIQDASFTTTFGYDGVVRGWSDEAIALVPSGDKPPLYLGMTIPYEKTLEPSGRTGPLIGSGKIIAFHVPSREGDTVPDQVIELEVQTEEGPVRTLLSLEEIPEAR